MRGTTLTELMITISILLVIGAVAIPAIYLFQKETDLADEALTVLNVLRLARSKALASEGASRWGVYFTTSTEPDQYVLFQGQSYTNRTTSSDETYQLPKSVEFSTIALAGKEVVFKPVVGDVIQGGEVWLQQKDDITEINTIYIANSGMISMSTSSVTDAGRIKDSRHVHVTYTRQIATSTESIILTFAGGTTQQIKISDHFKGGQLDWQGKVDVDGEMQQLQIHTHRLNNPDTLFCIHRDVRYNSKAVGIDIDGDPNYPAFSPTLLQYDVFNQTYKGGSASVDNPVWQ